jgi:hypothetical protein
VCEWGCNLHKINRWSRKWGKSHLAIIAFSPEGNPISIGRDGIALEANLSILIEHLPDNLDPVAQQFFLMNVVFVIDFEHLLPFHEEDFEQFAEII